MVPPSVQHSPVKRSGPATTAIRKEGGELPPSTKGPWKLLVSFEPTNTFLQELLSSAMCGVDWSQATMANPVVDCESDYVNVVSAAAN